jgi:hypothetical protein
VDPAQLRHDRSAERTATRRFGAARSSDQRFSVPAAGELPQPCQTLDSHHRNEDTLLFPAARRAAPQPAATMERSGLSRQWPNGGEDRHRRPLALHHVCGRGRGCRARHLFRPVARPKLGGCRAGHRNPSIQGVMSARNRSPSARTFSPLSNPYSPDRILACSPCSNMVSARSCGRGGYPLWNSSCWATDKHLTPDPLIKPCVNALGG